VALPDTVAVPTAVPPLVHVEGAVACGPNTVKVIVPLGLAPPDSEAEIDPVPMAVPTVSFDGPVAERAVAVLATTVSDMPAPQVEAAELLLVSPPYDAYHQ